MVIKILKNNKPTLIFFINFTILLKNIGNNSVQLQTFGTL